MLAIRETEIHYEKWLYPKKQENLFFIIIVSVILHALIIFSLTLIKDNNLAAFKEETAATKPPVHIQFKNSAQEKAAINALDTKKDQSLYVPKNRSGGVLTDKNPNSESRIKIPEHLQSSDNRIDKEPFNSTILPSENKRKLPTALPKNPKKDIESGMQSFLPHSSSSYIDQIRKQSRDPKPIQADSGDIPIIGQQMMPSNGPRVIERYATKDLSLYQFSQEFKEKFGGVWNSKERFVPPESPLRPGDVIYYKLYIKGDGNLEKFENLTQKKTPNKDFSGVDKIIKDVVSHVFPMTVPPRFSHSIVTEVIAIQVVGTNSPVQYSPQ